MEIIKPKYGQPIDLKTYNTLIKFLKEFNYLHPFMPFITEEIWHLISNRSNNPIVISKWPDEENNINHNILGDFQNLQSIISGIKF